jgi:hypothetical protein
MQAQPSHRWQGGGLARAWRGPGAGLARAWRGPGAERTLVSRVLDRTRRDYVAAGGLVAFRFFVRPSEWNIGTAVQI